MLLKRILLSFFILTSVVFAEVNLYTATLYKADVNSKTAYNLQQKGAMLIDVRTKAEFAQGRAKNSINIPIFFEQAGQRVFNKNFLNELYTTIGKDINKEIILICRSGSRTKLTANLLAQQGFPNIYNIKNGFQYDWIKTSLPVEK